MFSVGVRGWDVGLWEVGFQELLGVLVLGDNDYLGTVLRESTHPTFTIG